jgi:hypothetical protein
MKILFCNKCHKRIQIPAMFTGGNINAPKGVKLGCGDKNCKGHVKFFPELKKVEAEVLKT